MLTIPNIKKKPAKENNKSGNNKGKTEQQIPQKKSNNSKSVICAGGAKAQAKADVKFGVDGCHKHKGKHFVKSPKGAPMILSRRLSRRIMKASPLRSPIVACTLNFADSAKKAANKKQATKPKFRRPPRTA